MLRCWIRGGCRTFQQYQYSHENCIKLPIAMGTSLHYLYVYEYILAKVRRHRLSASRFIRIQHQLRSDFRVKILRRKESEGNGRLLQCRAFLVCLLRTLGNICAAIMSEQNDMRQTALTVIAQMAVQDSRQHQ